MKRFAKNAAGAFLGLVIGTAIVDLSHHEMPPKAGLIEWVIDWWNTPHKTPDKPVVKTVRVVGGAAA